MKRYLYGIAILALLIGLQACGAQRDSNQSNTQPSSPAQTNSAAPSAASGLVKAIHTAKDDGKGAPGEQTNSFGPSDRTIHCVVELAESRPGTKIKYSWWAVEAEGAQNDKIEDFEYTTRPQDKIVHGHLTMPEDWPPGKYRVEVFVNGNREQSLEFSVT